MCNNTLFGSIYLSDDLSFLRSIPDGMAKIISMDEEGMLNPNDPNVIIGTCMLPPIECLSAEIDGDLEAYRYFYYKHISASIQEDFFAVILAALHKGFNVLLYWPDMHESIGSKIFKQIIEDIYGIHIGTVGQDQCCWNDQYSWIWLTILYKHNIVSGRDFLYLYPESIRIDQDVMNNLIMELQPFGWSINDRERAIYTLCGHLKSNYNIRMPLRKVIQ